MLELRKDIFADERDDNLKEIGKGTQRQDMLGHVTGTSTYFNDHKLQGMLHLKVLRSPHAHARIRRIDTVEAERSPGVRRIIRGADVPRNLNTLLSLINFGKDDEPTLAVDKVRYKGEPVVAVVADSHREAFEAIAKVREIMATQDPIPAGLRVGVVGGGCSGFQYSMAFENQSGMMDKVFAFDDLKVFVDATSLMYLNGCTVDYVETLEAAGFKFENPQVKSTCGCGSSFSV